MFSILSIYLKAFSMQIRGVVFDFDYTLAALRPIDFLRIPTALSLLGQMRSILDQYRGFRSPRLTHEIEQHFHRPGEVLRYREYTTNLYRSHNILSETRKLLELCDEYDIPRGVLSDHPCLDKLQSIELHTGWSAVVDCQTYGALKPLPDALFSISSQLGVPPHQLLFIGDRWDTDGMMAAYAGAQFIIVENIQDALQQIRCRR
jgi:FMN phosphatase YigB (HAD superfamily)